MSADVEDDDAKWAREEEQSDVESAWEEQVTTVLSNSEIDPASKDKAFLWLKRYEGKVTPEQIAALKRSKYGRRFQEFIDLWKQLPKNEREHLFVASGMFARLAVITHGTYNELCHERKMLTAQREFTDLEVLQKAQWLQPYLWSEGWPQVDAFALAEPLNQYIHLGIEWPYLERLALKAAVNSVYQQQREKVKIPFKHPFVYLAARLVGWLLPTLVVIGVDVAIAIWSLAHLSGESASVWAIIGLVYLGLTVPISLVHAGTWETRSLLKRIAFPGYDPVESKVNADLNALHTAITMHHAEHVNLRLAREQLARLQSTDIQIPVQFITLIDRAIAKGVHSW